MSGRSGVLSRVRRSIKRGGGGKNTLEYIYIILNDPCVYCGEFGCDTLDHITPYSRREELNTGQGVDHFTNLAPCHGKCNWKRGNKGVLDHLLGFSLSRELKHD